jgi:phage-related tail fiber protein
MAETYKAVVTNKGLVKIEAAMAAGTSVMVTHMAFGDSNGTPYTPQASQTGLIHEVFRTALVSRTLVESIIKYTAVLLSTDPPGDYLELGLYDSDGELFAVANIPKLSHRPQESGAVTETDVSFALVAENASSVTIPLSSNVYVEKTYGDMHYIRTDGTNVPFDNISMNGKKFTSVGRGTTGTDSANVDQTLPIGSVVQNAGSVDPYGWVPCDHRVLSRLEYPELFTAIGVLYGAGDGSTTFNIPNMETTYTGTPMHYMIKIEV